MGFLKKLTVLAVLIVGGLWFYGRKIPREHSITSSVILVAPHDTVFKVVRAVDAMPSWWFDVKAAQPIIGKKRQSYELNRGADGLVRVEVTSVSAGRRVVLTVLNDEQKSWGGKWTCDVFLSSAGTEVVIREETWVDPPLARVYAKLRGRFRFVDSYLASLGAHFGETVTPRHAR